MDHLRSPRADPLRKILGTGFGLAICIGGAAGAANQHRPFKVALRIAKTHPSLLAPPQLLALVCIKSRLLVVVSCFESGFLTASGSA